MRPDFFWMGGMWMFPAVMFLVMFIVIGCVLGGVMRRGNVPCGRSKDDSPLEILKTRYAKGEIDRDEFEQMKKDLLD